MNNNRWLVLPLLAALSACGSDTQEPVLDINGHWNIDHGFYDPCQVNVTFTDEQMLLSFYSLEEGACQPEAYGIDNNVLAVRIDSKQDSFAEDGALTTTLQVSAPGYRAEGTIVLWQTGQGLAGSLTSASDPFGLLEPLLEPVYDLAPLSDRWVSRVLGKWSVRCDEMMLNHVGTELCEAIEFTSDVAGNIKSHGGSNTVSQGDVVEVSGHWDSVTFAVRNLVQTGVDGFEIEMTMLVRDLAVIPFSLSLSEEGVFMMSSDETGEGMTRVELIRVD